MVTFDWDRAKNESNRKKHGLGFETAKLVFDDPNCLTFVERIQAGEERWHAIGMIGQQVVITVVHTYRSAGSTERIPKEYVSSPPAVQIPKKGDFMQELTDDQRKEIAALSSQPDEEIDYSDIPPVREIPSNMVRGRFYRGPAIYLTGDVHAYFSTIALRRGVPINDLVNLVLSKEIAVLEELK